MEGVLYYESLKTSEEAANLQHDQIRQQQVSLRLQENQNEIVRQQQLRQVLANEEVQMGVRNIAPDSGTIRAITEQNFVNFMADENADKLNFMAKQQSLATEDKLVDVKKRSQDISSTASLLQNIEKSVMTVATSGAAGGAGAGAGSLFNMNLNG